MSDSLDQFYTKPEVALECAYSFTEYYKPSDFPLLEPAAGAGAFVYVFKLLDFKIYAMDIDPPYPDIPYGDYLQESVRVKYGKDFIKNYAIVGNPPFGNLSSIALKFFLKATRENAKVIAFILPKTFRKRSVINRIPLNYHLLLDKELDPDSYIKDGESYSVPACWQIWYQDNTKLRAIIPDYNVDDLLLYVKDRSDADIAIQRVGRSAGRVILKDSDLYDKLKSHSYYFIKLLDPTILSILSDIDWSDIKTQTAGVNSVGKAEIAEQLSIKLGRNSVADNNPVF